MLGKRKKPPTKQTGKKKKKKPPVNSQKAEDAKQFLIRGGYDLWDEKVWKPMEKEIEKKFKVKRSKYRDIRTQILREEAPFLRKELEKEATRKAVELKNKAVERAEKAEKQVGELKNEKTKWKTAFARCMKKPELNEAWKNIIIEWKEEGFIDIDLDEE